MTNAQSEYDLSSYPNKIVITDKYSILPYWDLNATFPKFMFNDTDIGQFLMNYGLVYYTDYVVTSASINELSIHFKCERTAIIFNILFGHKY